MTGKLEATIHAALDAFHIELPSWGFANTGTRFGKFIQPAAAITIEDKFSDAGQVHALTGSCPTIALHVQWDLPGGLKQVADIEALARKYGVQAGSINPNIFQDQEYKYGSFGNPDSAIRKRALDHILNSVAIADALKCRDIAPWFADGSNYPGTQNMRKRIAWFEESLKEVHSHLSAEQRLSHGYCRLGGGFPAGEECRAAGAGPG
jgi:L-rhamnose isomerase / sugar isomerase